MKLGWLPIAFFGAHLVETVQHGWAWDNLWACNVANLLLGIGMLARRPALVRGATLWIVAGFPFWLRELGLAPDTILPTSYLTHLGTLPIALGAFRPGKPVWPQALLAFLVLQELCRLVAAPESNVNVAFSMRDGWDRVFSSYWQYWLFSSAAAGATLALVDFVLQRAGRRSLPPDARA